MRRVRPLVAICLVLAAGCASASSVPTGAPAAVSPGPIAWINDPFPHVPGPKELPPVQPPRKSPACRVAQLKVIDAAHPGDTEDDGVIVEIRNTSRRACQLKGTVHAALHGPGAPVVHLVGTRQSEGWASFDMAPGRLTDVWLYATEGCESGPAKGLEAIPVTKVVIAVPTGGELAVTGLHVPRTCHGPTVSAFEQRLPEPRYAPGPLQGAKFYLQLPTTAQAGATLHYVVTIANPGDKPLPMSPCPGYLESLSAGTPGKNIFGLNCDGYIQLLPHQRLDFAMQLPVPADAPAGPAKVEWELEGVYPLVRKAIQVVR